MASVATLADQLVRIEHKLDLLLESRAGVDPMLIIRPVGDPSHICPVCLQAVSYHVDALNKVLTRTCGCSTGLHSPIDFQPFAPPTTENNGNDSEE